MQRDTTTPAQGPPPLYWKYNPAANEEILSLALDISTHAQLSEDEELAALLVRLLAAIAADCGDGRGCRVWLSTWLAMNVFFSNTRQGNNALFAYLVNDLKVARELRGEGGAR